MLTSAREAPVKKIKIYLNFNNNNNGVVKNRSLILSF